MALLATVGGAALATGAGYLVYRWIAAFLIQVSLRLLMHVDHAGQRMYERELVDHPDWEPGLPDKLWPHTTRKLRGDPEGLPRATEPIKGVTQ